MEYTGTRTKVGVRVVHLELLRGQRVFRGPVRMDPEGHFVVAPPDLRLARLFLDAQHLVQVWGLEELPAPLKQTHRGQLSGLTRGVTPRFGR